MFNLAPARVPRLLRFRLTLMGQRDSKRYSQSLDSTLTHALLEIQAMAHTGQNRVNKAFLDTASSLIASISVLKSNLERVNGELLESKAKAKTLAGRVLDRELANQSVIQRKAVELGSQLTSNLNTVELLQVQALQALNSWDTYYELLASTYVRRRLRLKGKAQPAEAEIPKFAPIALAQLDAELAKARGK
tara:strand:+ start:500 stop:1072 length:573 start_codon:yes stop_codon:yes gene_type:complete